MTIMFTDEELKRKQERANLQRHEAVVSGCPSAAAWNDGYAHAIADLRQLGRLREAADKLCTVPNSETSSSASSSV
jgi:hypothetical protein